MDASENKLAVVTGANTGLGFETSLGLAKENYTVVLACRSEEKANSAMARIRRQVPDASLDFIALDLVDRDSIRQFADTYSQRYDHLNLLVNNAGVMGPAHTLSRRMTWSCSSMPITLDIFT
jgi:NAD(P)-dependent dehydrogenase (short-subunit alcohol dehydrogenase family)